MANLEEEERLNETELQLQQVPSKSSMEDIQETDLETTAQDIKYDWYQSEEDVTITLFVKNINKENFNVTFTDDSMSISLTDNKNVVSNLNLMFYDFVRPSECSYKILTTKIEVKLRKLINGFWLNLDKKEHDRNVKQQINWDKFVKNEITGDDTQADINNFFQKIYNDGSDDVKRAMMKSYYESCGTVLTTNWSEVNSAEQSTLDYLR